MIGLKSILITLWQGRQTASLATSRINLQTTSRGNAQPATTPWIGRKPASTMQPPEQRIANPVMPRISQPTISPDNALPAIPPMPGARLILITAG